MYKYSIKVKSIKDGDTLTADIDLGFDTWLVEKDIRLNGIDTPEIHSKNLLEKEAGLCVKAYVQKLLSSAKTITVDSQEWDKYGRVLGDVIVDSVSLSQTLLLIGFALPYDGGTKSRWSDDLLNKIIEREV